MDDDETAPVTTVAAAQLTRAIRGRRVVAASYTPADLPKPAGADGRSRPGAAPVQRPGDAEKRAGVRIFYPHVLYRSIAGELVVDAFQVDGATSRGKRLPDWRAFRVSGLSDLVVLDAVFLPLPQLDLRKYGRRVVVHCLDGRLIDQLRDDDGGAS